MRLSPSSSSSPRPRAPRSSISSSLLLLSLFLAVAYSDDTSCKFSKDGRIWDLSKLAGVSSVVQKKHTPPAWKEMSWSINPCGTLPKDDKGCPDGTQICGIERTISDSKPEESIISAVIPIAGSGIPDGQHNEPKITPFKNPEDGSGNAIEGLSIEYTGGFYEGKQQKGVIKFICDSTKTGLEAQKEEGKEENEKEKEKEVALKFVSYNDEVLTMEWRTKEVCGKQDSDGGKGKDDGSHWGFFTWFIIIAFMSTAAYLIFGSWFNYNRYGARGWDLLPHADTIRDIPYLFKDFLRKVVNTIQTGGRSSRAGYSAV